MFHLRIRAKFYIYSYVSRDPEMKGSIKKKNNINSRDTQSRVCGGQTQTGARTEEYRAKRTAFGRRRTKNSGAACCDVIRSGRGMERRRRK